MNGVTVTLSRNGEEAPAKGASAIAGVLQALIPDAGAAAENVGTATVMKGAADKPEVEEVTVTLALGTAMMKGDAAVPAATDAIVA